MGFLLETKRLTLSKFKRTDSAFVAELVNTPGWLTYIGDRNIRSDEAAADYLVNGPIKSYKENGYGLWLVRTKADGKNIGMCGFLKREYLPHPDIGFAFLPEYEGLGYAIEIVTAVLDYGAAQYNMSVILAITQDNNHRSIALLGKTGFLKCGLQRVPHESKELILFRKEC